MVDSNSSSLLLATVHLASFIAGLLLSPGKRNKSTARILEAPRKYEKLVMYDMCDSISK